MTASLLAIDLGTTRIKFGALDDDGTYRLDHSADAQTVFPEPGDDILVLPSGALSAGGGRRLVFCGVDVAHRRGHLYRAILEGLACEYAMMAEDLAAAGVPMRAPVMGSDGRTPARRDNQPGSGRSGALQETLATLSASAPDASRVERGHVKLLDGNTWPMS